MGTSNTKATSFCHSAVMCCVIVSLELDEQLQFQSSSWIGWYGRTVTFFPDVNIAYIFPFQLQVFWRCSEFFRRFIVFTFSRVRSSVTAYLVWKYRKYIGTAGSCTGITSSDSYCYHNCPNYNICYAYKTYVCSSGSCVSGVKSTDGYCYSNYCPDYSYLGSCYKYKTRVSYRDSCTGVRMLDHQTITATNITVLTTSTAGHVTGTENTSGVSSPAAVWNLPTTIAIITESLTSISERFRTFLILCPLWVVVCHKVVF